jgi:O-acetyl-ADP-ribose deacetylase (regulator of RNase III)
MIKYASGNLLEAPVEALVNTVNTEGVMGKGIALQFKRAFPQVNSEYQKACASGLVKLGAMHAVDLGGLAGGPRWVINFPTKGHWRSKSRLQDIRSGLQDLVRLIRELKIRSIAVPPLGCGNGGLDWGDVRPLIESAFSNLPDVEVLLFSPTGAPLPAEMPTRTDRPKMTVGRAALISLVERYQLGLLDPIVTLLEVHKLMYFLQAAGQPLKLNFRQAKFGPYSDVLRQVLIRLEGHYISGYGDGKDRPDTPIELMLGAADEARDFLRDQPDVRSRIEGVTRLIEGYEDPYGLELLSSVHWVMTSEPTVAVSQQSVVSAVHAWNDGKRKRLRVEHLAKAWSRVRSADSAFANLVSESAPNNC